MGPRDPVFYLPFPTSAVQPSAGIHHMGGSSSQPGVCRPLQASVSPSVHPNTSSSWLRTCGLEAALWKSVSSLFFSCCRPPPPPMFPVPFPSRVKHDITEPRAHSTHRPLSLVSLVCHSLPSVQLRTENQEKSAHCPELWGGRWRLRGGQMLFLWLALQSDFLWSPCSGRM